MKRKHLFLIGSIVLIPIIYFGCQYYWLSRTYELPYSNLLNMSTSSCYINFKIEKGDSIYQVVMPNTLAYRFVEERSKFLGYIYPLYMKDIIENEKAISVNDSLFEFASIFMVDTQNIKKYVNRDLANDTTIFRNRNFLRYDIRNADRNAIIYLYLKQGLNCCVDDISGAVKVFNAEY